MALRLECIHVVHDLAAKERTAVFKCWLIYDDLCALCLDTFHNALNGRLAEVIAVRFHCQAINTYHAVMLLARIIAIIISIVVITSFL